ncbi:MAG: sulfotransferase [Deltaproteobacteria bacterium]|nr:sulfotransferase [Deltaproteobacteria bacterium]
MLRTPRIAFLAGYGRNGGTLLDRTLGSFQGAVSLGELRFVWRKGLQRNELCSCGLAFRDCQFWREVFDLAYGGFERVDADAMIRLYRAVDRTRYVPFLASALRPAGFEQRATELARRLSPLYAAIAQVSGAEVLVDSSKFAGYGWILSRLEGFETYTIHLVRDPRAASYSWSKSVRKPEVANSEALMPRANPVSAAVQWTYRNLAAETLRRCSTRYRRVRYEDFARAPREQGEELARWLGLEPAVRSAFITDNEVMLEPGHTQSGNPVRFRSGATTIKVDDEWRTKMPRTQRLTVGCLTAPLRSRYGYR